jgi:hypothetical protein
VNIDLGVVLPCLDIVIKSTGQGKQNKNNNNNDDDMKITSTTLM